MFKKFKFSFRKRSIANLNPKIQQENNYDPVCGMLATGDFFVINDQEHDYYFCSEYCRIKFADDPSAYIK